MIGPALGLDLSTPQAFRTAISAGTDPSAAGKAFIDRKQIKVYVYHSQNATPDVQRPRSTARRSRCCPLRTNARSWSASRRARGAVSRTQGVVAARWAGRRGGTRLEA